MHSHEWKLPPDRLHLLDVGDRRTIRFLSVEPQWEAITIGNSLPRLNWVIQGGESGNAATHFELEWADQLSTECKAAHVPYFLKQLGSHVTRKGKRIPFTNWEAGDWAEWPARLRVRQMPKPNAVRVGHRGRAVGFTMAMLQRRGHLPASALPFRLMTSITSRRS